MVVPFPESSEFGDELSEEFRHRLKAELQPGERLLWSGQGKLRSRTGCSPTSVGLFAAICFMLLGIVSVAFNGRPEGHPDAASLLVFGLSFAAVILFISWLNGWLKEYSKQSPLDGGLYALTDRRAIIWRRAPLKAGAVEVISIAKGQARMIRRVEYPDGSGDVLFTVADARLPDGELTAPGGFEGITEVRRIEDLARRVLFVDPGQNES